MNIHILQHVSFETPGRISEWAALRNHNLSFTFLFDAAPVYPSPAVIDMLVILGGPMAVYEEMSYAWMTAEKAFIRDCIHRQKIIMGICLGAQLLAGALGAAVYPHTEKEIGFFPVTLHTAPLLTHLPRSWEVFHWHGDTFDLPEGAVRLAYSEACVNQAFQKGKCVGIQFHPEVTAGLIGQMLQHEQEEIAVARYVQDVQTIRQKSRHMTDDPEPFFGLMDKIIVL